MSCGDEEWLRLQAERAERELRGRLRSAAADPAQAALLRRAFDRACADDLGGSFGPPQLALAAYVGAGGPDPTHGRLAAQVAAAFWAGAKLLDDHADGELDATWSDPTTVTFAGFGLSTLVVPWLLGEGTVADTRRIVALRIVAEEGLRSLAGQHLDLSHRGAPRPDPGTVERAAEGKNGAPHALFIGVGAALAGATGDRLSAFLEYGRALGTLRQLHSDASELVFSEDARDLMQGNRPLLAALALRDGSPEQQALLREAMHAAPSCREALETARSLLRGTRIFLRFLDVVGRWEQAARDHLARAEVAAPTNTQLALLVEELTPRCSTSQEARPIMPSTRTADRGGERA